MHIKRHFLERTADNVGQVLKHQLWVEIVGVDFLCPMQRRNKFGRVPLGKGQIDDVCPRWRIEQLKDSPLITFAQSIKERVRARVRRF